jgi:hypothetical protein
VSSFRAATILSVGVLALAFAGRAQDDFEIPELLTPEEEAQRELERKRRAPPVLSCSPGSLLASMKEGETGHLVVTIRNTGGRTLEWEIESAPDWLEVTKVAGSLGYGEKEQLGLLAKPASGTTGTVSGSVVIRAPGAGGSPVSIPVTLEIEPKPEPPVLPPQEPPEIPIAPPRRKNALGVRAGVLLPSSGDTADYDANFVFGIYYRIPVRRVATLSYELSLDIGGEDEVSDYESRSVMGDASLVFALGGEPGRRGGYLLSGIGVLMEFVDEQTTGASYTNYATMITLGGGLVFADGRLDARLAYGIFVGSDNVPGQALLALNYSF